jgi:Uma2 family endonuclease
MNAIPKLATFTADEFDLMARRGDFARRCHVELLDGVIYEMNAQYARHARVKLTLANLLISTLASRQNVEVFVEVSVKLGDHSVPMPDIVLAHTTAADGFVPAKDVLLLIEIADSTLRTDLGRKQKLYAAANIPEYWVVDVEGKIIHQHAQPSGEIYAQVEQVAFGERLQMKTMDRLEIECQF